MAYIAAFDAGTTAVKGTLVNEAGAAVLSCSVELSTLCRDGFQEQAPRDWWAAFCEISLFILIIKSQHVSVLSYISHYKI